MLAAARRAALDVLLDRTVFAVDPKAYAEFVARLDAPPRPNPRLRRSLQTPAPWEKSPELLADRRQIADFNSGEASLDDWLNRRARANRVSGATRTYVLCGNERVIGYYALGSGAVTAEGAPGRFRRNMPK